MKQNKDALVAAAGDIYVDVYTDGRRYAGGNCLNVAVHMKRLDIETRFCGAVGTDENGKFALDAINRAGLDTSRIRVIEGETAKTLVRLVNGNREFLEYPLGVMEQYYLGEDELDYLSGCRIVHSAMWGCVHNDLYKLRERGVKISFDFSDIYEGEITETAIRNCDYAFFSYSESDDEYIRGFIKDMQSKGPEIVFATFGDRGSLAYNGEYYTKCGIVPADAVDTLGAGDSYIAGTLVGLVRGLSLGDSMLQGARVASETITFFGAW